MLAGAAGFEPATLGFGVVQCLFWPVPEAPWECLPVTILGVSYIDTSLQISGSP
jgi:hypothetical protein